MVMASSSCASTLVVQLFLCLVFYLALNLGNPYKSSIFHTPTPPPPLDIYFLTVNVNVNGGAYTEHHTHLLKQMEIVARVYKVKFILNISELGEDDSLAFNASRLFSSMNVPWYTTAASKDQEGACFLEQIHINNREILTLVGVNTQSLQRSASGLGNNQSNWLSQTLEAAAGSWLIVVGHHPVVVCETNGEQIKSKHVYEPLHRIFMTYGVNAYLSGQGCTNINNALEDGVAYIGTGGPYPIKSEPHLATLSKSSAFQKKRKMDVGFLLHRVSSAEFTTYFISLFGEVLHKIVIRQKGKEVM